jgi:hypothetical protein
MLQTVSWFLPELPLFLLSAVATHLVMSFAQTVMHYKLGHQVLPQPHQLPSHLLFQRSSRLTDVFGARRQQHAFLLYSCVFGGSVYIPRIANGTLRGSGGRVCGVVLRTRRFRQGIPRRGSWLERFAWFRRKQELHFVHHRHANSNFAVIHFFWDRILGTYRRPDAG